MGKAYYFVKRSGNCNQCGSEYMRWAFSTEYTSKTALKKAHTTGRRSVRMADIYTPQQLLQRFCSINRSFAPERKRKHGRQEDRC